MAQRFLSSLSQARVFWKDGPEENPGMEFPQSPRPQQSPKAIPGPAMPSSSPNSPHSWLCLEVEGLEVSLLVALLGWNGCIEGRQGRKSIRPKPVTFPSTPHSSCFI